MLRKWLSVTHGITVACQAVANVTLLIAIGLTLGAMFTSEWQIANFGNGEYYEHGLIKDCLRSTHGYGFGGVPTGNKGVSGLKDSNLDGDWMCFWKFEQQYQEQAVSKDIVLNNWQVSTLVMLGAACGLALVAVVCSCLTCSLKYCSIPWAIFSLLAAVLSLTGLILYLRWSVETGNRAFKLWRLSFEFQMTDAVMHQQYGVSLSIAVGGCVLFFLGTLLAGVSIGLVFREGKLKRQSNGNGNGNVTLNSNHVGFAADSDVRKYSSPPPYKMSGSVKSHSTRDDAKPSLNDSLDYIITDNVGVLSEPHRGRSPTL